MRGKIFELEITEFNQDRVTVVVRTGNPYELISPIPGFDRIPTGRENEKMFFRKVGTATPSEIKKVIEAWVADECVPNNWRCLDSDVHVGTKYQLVKRAVVKVSKDKD